MYPRRRVGVLKGKACRGVRGALVAVCLANEGGLRDRRRLVKGTSAAAVATSARVLTHTPATFLRWSRCPGPANGFILPRSG